jgi:hypothetical protein
MKNIPILLLLAIILGFYSCSDNSVKSSKPKYINGDIGSYWIFENIPVDIQNVFDRDSSFIDSTYISDKVRLLDEDCSVFTTDNYEDGELSSTTVMYLREEDEKIFTHSGFVTNAFDNFPMDLPFELEEKWIKIADFNDDLWRVYEVDIDTIEIPLIGAKMLGKVNVMGSKENMESVNIGENNVNAQKFRLEIVFTGTIIFNGIPIAFNPERIVDIWIAENIGMVKNFEHPSVIALPFIGDMPIDGNDRTLIRYKIQ